MAIKFLLIFACFGLFCSVVWANPSKVVVRSEEGRWVTELITVSADGWPEVQERKTFPNKKLATAQQMQWQQSSTFTTTSELNFEPQMASGVLWKTTQSWSVEWEEAYGRWIENEVDAEFFVRYNIATDCADVAYSLRWIFSRIHGLPAAARLGGSNVLLTNETLRSNWANLPTSTDWHKDRRFLAALNYLLDLTYTHTLWEDSFPMALTKKDLLSGSYHLSLRDQSGHTQLIHWLGSGSGVPFLTLNSTVPRKVRSLMDSMMFAEYPKDKAGAILRFRWAVKGNSGMSLKKASEMPGYSLEQFSFKSDNKDFTIALFEKLGFTGGKEAIRDYLYQDVFNQMQARIAVVNDGYKECQKIDCSPGTVGWEDWSTPSRDSRIKGKMQVLGNIRVPGKNPEILEKELLYIDGVSWPFKSFLWNWESDAIDSDPRSSIVRRWSAGGEEWLNEQQSFLQAKTQERKQHLEKSKELCQKQNCAFPSAAWENASANKMDVEINKRVMYLTAKPQEFPVEVQKGLSSRTANVLTQINGQNLTWEHLFERHLEMNASPLATLEDQWALSAEPQLIKVNSFGTKAYFDRWFLSNSDTLIEKKTGKKLILPYESIFVFEQAPIVIGFGSKETVFHNIVTGQKILVPVELSELEASEVVAADDGNFVVKRGNQFEAWTLDSSTLTAAYAQTLPGEGWHANQGILQSKDGDLFDIKYLRLILADKVVQVFMKNDQAILYRSMTSAFIMDRVLGKKAVLPNSDLNYALILDSRKSEILGSKMRETYIYKWNAQLEFSLLQTIPGFCFPKGDDFLSCMIGTGNTTYIHDGISWKLVNLGEGIRDLNKVHMLRNGKTNEVIDRKTGKVIFSAPSISLLHDHFFVAKTKADGLGHVIDGRDLTKPLYTNLFNFEYGVGVGKMGDDVALTPYSAENRPFTIIWKSATH